MWWFFIGHGPALGGVFQIFQSFLSMRKMFLEAVYFFPLLGDHITQILNLLVLIGDAILYFQKAFRFCGHNMAQF